MLFLKNLFTDFKIVSAEEMFLNGVKPRSEDSPLKWTNSEEHNKLSRDSSNLKITLEPMQIRTFIVNVN